MTERPVLFVKLSSRGDRIRPALDERFEVVEIDTLYEGGYYSLPVLGKLLRSVKLLMSINTTQPMAVMFDSLGVFALLQGLIAQVVDVPFILRTRGGMWGEFADEARVRGVSNTVWYSIKKDAIRNVVLYVTDGILAVSYFQRLQMISELSIPPEEIRVVHEPINNNDFDKVAPRKLRENLDIPQECPIITTVTSFDYEMKYAGVEYFLPAIIDILKARPNVYFVIAGSGKAAESATRSLKRRVPSEIEERVILLGEYSPIEELYQESDVYVHLSFWDSMGQPVLKAQSAGLPVIVNDGGGMVELLHDDYKCYVVREPEHPAENLKCNSTPSEQNAIFTSPTG